MNKLILIIKREFLAKVRNKSFIVMTFLSPLLFVGIGVFVGFLSTMKSEQKTIAIHDKSSRFINQFKSDEEFLYKNLSAIDTKILKDSIIKESYEGLLIIPENQDNILLQKNIEYVSNDSPSVEFISNIEEIINKKITDENFQSQGIDTLKINNAKSDISIKLSKATGETALKGFNEIKTIIGGAFGYLIMMFIILYGNMVMRSVIEEKTSRIIEVIISSVKPFQLMMGKIIGTSLAGILQFLIWALLGLTAMFIVSNLFRSTNGSKSNKRPSHASSTKSHERTSANVSTRTLESSNSNNSHIFYRLFHRRILFIRSFYAAIGAAVDNETDSSTISSTNYYAINIRSLHRIFYSNK